MKKQGWISIYFFYNGDLNDVLRNLIIPFLKDVTKQEVSQWFFIRYYENGPHIRLRLKGNLELLSGQITERIGTLSYLFYNTSEISKGYLIMQQYLPEKERYGGNVGIKLAERLFYISSGITLKLIKNSDWNYSMAIGYSIQLNLIFLKHFINDLKEIDLFLNAASNSWNSAYAQINNQTIDEVLDKMEGAYVKQKDGIHNALNNLYRRLFTNIKIDQILLQDWNVKIKLIHKDYILKEYHIIDKIRTLDNQSINQAKIWGLFESYMHMTNNRLGLLNYDEGYVYYILRMFLSTKGIRQNLFK